MLKQSSRVTNSLSASSQPTGLAPLLQFSWQLRIPNSLVRTALRMLSDWKLRRFASPSRTNTDLTSLLATDRINCRTNSLWGMPNDWVMPLPIRRLPCEEGMMRSKLVRTSLTLPSASLAMTAGTSLQNWRPSLLKMAAANFPSSDVPTKWKWRLTDRERMVGGIFVRSVLHRMNLACAGGSSRILSIEQKAGEVSWWASSMTTILNLESTGEPEHPSKTETISSRPR